MIWCKKYNTSNLPEGCWFRNKSCEECIEEDKRSKERVAQIIKERQERLGIQKEHIEFGW